MSAAEEIRETVRRRYAAAATRSAAGDHEGALAVETACCGPAPVATTDEQGRVVFGADLYGPEAQGAPDGAVSASLGCGIPTSVADLHPVDRDPVMVDDCPHKRLPFPGPRAPKGVTVQFGTHCGQPNSDNAVEDHHHHEDRRLKVLGEQPVTQRGHVAKHDDRDPVDAVGDGRA